MKGLPFYWNSQQGNALTSLKGRARGLKNDTVPASPARRAAGARFLCAESVAGPRRLADHRRADRPVTAYQRARGAAAGRACRSIALRLSGDRKAWLSFHGYEIAALIVAAALGYALPYLPHLP